MGYRAAIGIGFLFFVLAIINIAAGMYIPAMLLFLGATISFSMAGRHKKPIPNITLNPDVSALAKSTVPVNIENKIIFTSEGKPVEEKYNKSPIH